MSAGELMPARSASARPVDTAFLKLLESFKVRVNCVKGLAEFVSAAVREYAFTSTL